MSEVSLPRTIQDLQNPEFAGYMQPVDEARLAQMSQEEALKHFQTSEFISNQFKGIGRNQPFPGREADVPVRAALSALSVAQKAGIDSKKLTKLAIDAHFGARGQDRELSNEWHKKLIAPYLVEHRPAKSGLLGMGQKLIAGKDYFSERLSPEEVSSHFEATAVVLEGLSESVDTLKPSQPQAKMMLQALTSMESLGQAYKKELPAAKMMGWLDVANKIVPPVARERLSDINSADMDKLDALTQTYLTPFEGAIAKGVRLDADMAQACLKRADNGFHKASQSVVRSSIKEAAGAPAAEVAQSLRDALAYPTGMDSMAVARYKELYADHIAPAAVIHPLGEPLDKTMAQNRFEVAQSLSGETDSLAAKMVPAAISVAEAAEVSDPNIALQLCQAYKCVGSQQIPDEIKQPCQNALDRYLPQGDFEFSKISPRAVSVASFIAQNPSNYSFTPEFPKLAKNFLGTCKTKFDAMEKGGGSLGSHDKVPGQLFSSLAAHFDMDSPDSIVEHDQD